ncbi:hypothetical protein GINT2_000302 [Glugoides intestinalis]
MNRASFEKLPENKKQIIEKAYFAAYNKEITASDFFAVCRRALNEDEFNALFTEVPANEENKQEQQQEIKTEHLEDIMQYSGIDLKEEAENIVKEAEYNVHYEQNDNREDKNSRIDSLFNTTQFQDFVLRIVAQRQMKITSEGIYVIFQVMKRNIIALVERMDAVAKVRTEGNLVEFNFKIENEGVKQLWYLNEMEKVLEDKLMLKKDDDQKKKKVIQEREDLVIKKKQSSSVAMAAMGIEQKSWMIGDGLKSVDDTSKFTSIYSPFDEKGFESRIKNRTITMKDFLYVLECDKRYNKSFFLVQYYFK